MSVEDEPRSIRTCTSKTDENVNKVRAQRDVWLTFDRMIVSELNLGSPNRPRHSYRGIGQAGNLCKRTKEKPKECMPGPSWTLRKWRNFFFQTCHNRWWIVDFRMRSRNKRTEFGVAREQHTVLEESKNEQIKMESCWFVFFSDSQGVVYKKIVPQEQTVNQQYYREVLGRLRKSSSCSARDCGHFDAASLQRSMSHCHLRERIFEQKGNSSGSTVPILAWSESVWLLLLPFHKTKIPPQRS